MKRARSCLLLVIAVVAARAAAQDAPVSDPLPDWITSRLVELDPADPLAYFELGEEVAAEVSTRAEEVLSRQLFGLAYALDRADGSPTWIAPSACVALADLARLESDQRWLMALANRLDPGYGVPDWQDPSRSGGVSDVAFETAETIGEIRAGNGIRVRGSLESPRVRELILRYGQLMGFSAGSGALWQVDQWAGAWPCRECGNERVIFRPNTNPPSYRECYTCRGDPGPELSRAELVAQLRFESRLLHGISRSWGAQLAVDFGAPLREPSPDGLLNVLGVSAEAPYWREGAWVESARGPTVEPETGVAGDDEQ